MVSPRTRWRSWRRGGTRTLIWGARWRRSPTWARVASWASSTTRTRRTRSSTSSSRCDSEGSSLPCEPGATKPRSGHGSGRRPQWSRLAGGPAGDPDDATHEQPVEGLVGVLRHGAGQPIGEVVGQRGRRVADVPELGAHPPEPRPVVVLPALDEQGTPRVGRQVGLALKPGGRLGLDRVDRDADVPVVAHGIHDRDRVGAAVGVQGAQHAVDLLAQAGHSRLLVEPHRVRSSSSGGAQKVWSQPPPIPGHDETAGHTMVTCGFGGGGQGRGRTADLPIFSRTLVPTELPGRDNEWNYSRPLGASGKPPAAGASRACAGSSGGMGRTAGGGSGPGLRAPHLPTNEAIVKDSSTLGRERMPRLIHRPAGERP